MLRKVLRFTGALLMIVLLVFSLSLCGGGGDESSDEDVAAAFSSNTSLGAMIVNSDGETLVAMTEADASGNLTAVTGAVWSSPSGATVIVYLGSDGLPQKMVIGDYIILYSNYTDTTVDIAKIYTPSGFIEIFRGVSIDTSSLTALHLNFKAVTCFPTCDTDLQNLAEVVKLAGGVISVAGCAIAVPVSLGAAALPCAGAILFTAQQLTGDETFLNATGSLSTVLNGLGCATGTDPTRCLDLLIDVAATDIELADALITDEAATVTSADVFLSGSESGVVVAGDGEPDCSSDYQCTPGESVSCFPEGTKQCASDCTWGTCVTASSTPENCGDGLCDSSGGETNSNCSGDCPIECGDGFCSLEGGEPSTCLADCPQSTCCVDSGGCPSETSFTCPGSCCCCASGQTCHLVNASWLCSAGD